MTTTDFTEHTDQPSEFVKRLLQQFHTVQAEADISARSSQRIGAFIARRAERQEQQWSRTDLKRKLGDVFRELEISGPQIIANTKEPGRERAILLLESEMDTMITALTELSKPRYATGSDLFRDLAHDGPASDLAQRPRKKVFQERRSFSDAISVKP